MKKILLATCALLALAGCGGPGDITQKQAVIQSIVPGESKEQVTQKLGLPGKVKQKEAGKEEWFYCSTGMASDTYYKITMDKGRVANVSQQAAALVNGYCSLAYSIPTQEELIEADASKCNAYGLKKGTPAYADCMMKQDTQRTMQKTIRLQQQEDARRQNQAASDEFLRTYGGVFGRPAQKLNNPINCNTYYNRWGANTTCQ